MIERIECIPRLDAREALLGRHIEVHNQVRPLHKVGHVLAQRTVRLKVALLEQPLLHQHLGKDHVLVDGAVLRLPRSHKVYKHSMNCEFDGSMKHIKQKKMEIGTTKMPVAETC